MPRSFSLCRRLSAYFPATFYISFHVTYPGLRRQTQPRGCPLQPAAVAVAVAAAAAPFLSASESTPHNLAVAVLSHELVFPCCWYCCCFPLHRRSDAPAAACRCISRRRLLLLSLLALILLLGSVFDSPCCCCSYCSRCGEAAADVGTNCGVAVLASAAAASVAE